MKTGNTPRPVPGGPVSQCASMEPGHEDREYHQALDQGEQESRASMEPGHEDREYTPFVSRDIPSCTCLNGARS